MPTMQFETRTNSIYGYSDTYEGTKPEDELMIWRIRLAHMPFNRLMKMAHTVESPKNCQNAKSLNDMHTCMEKLPGYPGESKGTVLSTLGHHIYQENLYQ
jgi:hypothetical protein